MSAGEGALAPRGLRPLRLLACAVGFPIEDIASDLGVFRRPSFGRTADICCCATPILEELPEQTSDSLSVDAQIFLQHFCKLTFGALRTMVGKAQEADPLQKRDRPKTSIFASIDLRNRSIEKQTPI